MRIEAFLQQSPLFEINRASRKFASSLNGILGSGDTNFLEALVLLSILFEEPNTVGPSQLADVLSTTRGNIGHCISSLEAKGLLRRRIDPEDARGFQLFIKPQGRKCAMGAMRTLDELQRQLEK